MQQGLGILVVDLQPVELERLQGAGDPDRALGLEVVVDVQADIDVRADRVPHDGDLSHRLVDEVGLGKLVVALAVPPLRDGRRRIAREQDVGLERGVALVDGLTGAVSDVIPGAERLRSPELVVTRPVGSEMGPVDPLLLPERTADNPVDRYVERLALDVPQRQFDACDGPRCDAVWRAPVGAVQVEVDTLDRRRVAPDQPRAHITNQALQAVGDTALAKLPVTGNARVGPYGDEVPGPGPAINRERVYPGDLHGAGAPPRIRGGWAICGLEMG